MVGESFHPRGQAFFVDLGNRFWCGDQEKHKNTSLKPAHKQFLQGFTLVSFVQENKQCDESTSYDSTHLDINHLDDPSR